MTTEKILEKLSRIVAAGNAGQSIVEVMPELIALTKDVEQAFCEEKASSHGMGNAVKTIKAILKSNDDNRKALSYPWIDSAGRQCICNGFIAFRLNDSLPLPERPKNIGDAIDLDRIVPVDISGWFELPMPSAKEIRAAIAIQRGQWTGRPKDFYAEWDFGPEAPTVNAKYLLDLVTVLPNADKLYWLRLNSALYAKCDAGEALLLPIRKTEKTAPKPTAEQAAAMEREDERAAANRADAEKRRQIERENRAHEEHDRAMKDRENAVKWQNEIKRSLKKATSSGMIYSYNCELLNARQAEAKAFLEAYTTALEYSPDESVEIDEFIDIVNKLNRVPVAV